MNQNLTNISNTKHQFMCENIAFVVDKKYEFIKQVGQRQYGVVCSAKNKENGNLVAIKKVWNYYNDQYDLNDIKNAVKQIKLLKFFNHDNIISLVDIIKPNCITDKEFYQVFNYMETDLHRVIYFHQQLSDEHIQYLIYQILLGLFHIHSANVIHCDLKPSNILLNQNCDLRICGFSFAQGLDGYYHQKESSVRNLYASPEYILNGYNDNPSIDVWSVGCIVAELLGRRPLFTPDNNYYLCSQATM